MDNTHTYHTEFNLLDKLGGTRPTAVELTYRASDPFAVELTMTYQPLRTVRWLVARSLLAEGVLAPAGVGDVRLQPLPCGTVSIELLPPDGYALLHARTQDLLQFLSQTYDLVRPGAEQIDIDQLIEHLVNGQQQQ